MAKNDTSVSDDSTASEAPELEADVESVEATAPPQTEPMVPQESQLARDPGKTLGVVALIVSLVAGVVGIVLGALSYRKSRAADFGGGLGMAAIIVGAITTVLLGTQLFLLANGMGIGGACDGRKPGVYELENGTVISCT